MNLFELIQLIPIFIEKTFNIRNIKAQGEKEMIGKFYLGLQYDY